MSKIFRRFICWYKGHLMFHIKDLGQNCHELCCFRCERRYFIHEKYSLELEVTEESKIRVLSAIDSKRYAEEIKTLPLHKRVYKKWFS